MGASTVPAQRSAPASARSLCASAAATSAWRLIRAMAALKWHRIIAVWPLLGMDSGVHPMSLIIHRASSLSSLRFQLYGKEEDTAANRGESIMRQRRNFAWT